MVVPGLYGYVSATKWVVDLEVTQFSKVNAYWTQRGWSDHAPIKTSSRIDVPKGLPGDARAVVKGDATVPQIAAASILAKVLRDRLMARLGLRHGHYGWHANAGYGTRSHRAAIVTHGATRHHRSTFGDLFAASGRSQCLVAQAAPDTERLHGREDIVDAV